jgi:hypothetical protein
MEVKKNGDTNQIIENINNIKTLKLINDEKKKEIKQLNLILDNSKILFNT